MVQEQPITVEIDGHIYDTSTGEEVYVRPASKPQEWAPTTDEDFEWLGKTLSEYDSTVAAIEARRKFVNDNFDAMARDAKKPKDGLLWKFGKMIEDYARTNLPKGKKTWTCPFMSVAFKTAPARPVVTDKDLALEWAKTECPSAVVVKEEFQISKIGSKKDDIMALGGIPKHGIEVVPESESVTIKTG